MRLAGILLLAIGISAPAADRTPVLVDTDLGSEIDDAFALALIVASPELELVGVTTVGGPAEDRAWLACRFLTQVGVKDIPVAFGRDPQPKSDLDWQIQYRRHPAAIFNRTLKPVKESAPDLTARIAGKHAGKLTLICLGPLTNVARFLKEHPDAAKQVGRIVVMGGSIAVGYDGKPKPEPEWNVKLDVAAAKAVFTAGIPLTVIPLDATATVKLDRERRERLFAARTPLTYQVQNLYELWDQETPVLFDPVAVAAAFDDRFLSMKDLQVAVDDQGMTVVREGKSNARVAVGVKADDFTRWYVERVRGVGKESLPKPLRNGSKPVEPGAFPARVHVVEDYETDIEKRWWMCGKLETKLVPVRGSRACKAVLTQDFDDKQGDVATMYRAVIFNPVPGPPMGPNTRLRFRYKLSGTDTIRVQLYSLSNGYHRYLSVSGLEQGKWADGAVDITQMRRPDGSGGPLAADERIDDIQFYVDPRAELLIDDIVLYDAAAVGEKRPFPKRVIFTGWFDTGKQGQEWPGDFEIVPHEKPRTWKAARSVINSATRDPWLRVGLRGARKIAPVTELAFRYHVTGTDRIVVELRDAKSGRVTAVDWTPEKRDEWADATLKFERGEVANELRFLLPKGSRLTVDDVLLYEPGAGGK